jgi:hypothetical protein
VEAFFSLWPCEEEELGIQHLLEMAKWKP